MPTKLKKQTANELKELGIDLMDLREVILCPYCYEVHEEEVPAEQIEHNSHKYFCRSCGLIVSLQ